MRWAKSLIASLLIVIVITVVIAIAILSLDSNDYKKLLIGWTNSATAGRLTLDGPVTVDWRKAPIVSLSKLSYVSADHMDRIEIGDLGFQIELYPLIHGMVVIRHLSIKNGRFVFTENPGEPEEASSKNSRVKIPILQRVRLSNLSFEFHDQRQNQTKQVFFENLTIDSNDVGGLLSIDGSGALGDRRFNVGGNMGNLDISADSKQPFPINILIRLPHSSLAIEGSVVQPRVGRGLSLDVKLDVEDFSQAITSLGMNIPTLGRLNVDGKLNGDFSNPFLSDTHIALGNGDSLQLNAKGTVRELLGEFDAEFRVRGKIADPHVIQWLVPNQMLFVDAIKLDGILRLKPNNGYFENLNFVTSKKNNSMDLNLAGDIGFGKQGADWRFTDVNLSLDADIKNLSTILPKLRPEYSNLVRLTLAGQLIGSQSVLGFTSANISLSKERLVALNATGEISDLSEFSGVNLVVKGTVADSSVIGQWLPDKIAKTARLNILTNLTKRAENWRFDNLSLKIDNTEGFSGQLDGLVEIAKDSTETKILKADFNAHIMASSIANLGGSYPLLKPQIGPLRGSAHISAITNGMSIENIDLELGEGPMAFSAKGRIGNVNGLNSDDWQWDGFDVELAFRSDEGRLGDWFQLLSEYRLSPFSIHGRYTGSLRKGLYSGEFIAAKSKISTNIALSNRQNKTQLSGDLRSAKLYLSDLGLTQSTIQKNPKTKSVSTASKYFFSRETLPLPTLFATDLDFKISADQIVGLGSEITQLETGFEVKNANVRLKDGKFNMADGSWNFNASMSTVGVPNLNFKLTTNNINAALLTVGKAKVAPLKGVLFFSADLSSQGRSYYDLASHLDGKIGLALVKGEVKDVDFDLLGLRLIKLAIPVLGDSDSSKVNCAVADFVFNDGLGRSRVFYIDTPNVIARGEGQLNFKRETVDMMIRTEPKRSIFLAGLPVHIGGLLVDPSVHPVPISAAVQFAAKLALNPISIPGKALGYVASLTELLGSSSTQCAPD